tara:strand:- start:476 stop:928 length:453 start_codon:yes stop_codon:yes gene_type:complete
MSKYDNFLNKIDSYRSSHEYLSGKAKDQFAFDVDTEMRIKRITKKQMAERMNTSAAYVTKVLRSDANLTFETVGKILHALGVKDFHVVMAKPDLKTYSERRFNAFVQSVIDEPKLIDVDCLGFDKVLVDIEAMPAMMWKYDPATELERVH